MPSLSSSLALVPAYLASQQILGALRPRYRALEKLELKAGESMVDVGCGPAYYLKRLPAGVDYHGYDTSERYIDWSRAKFGDRAEFTVGTFGAESAAKLGRVDAFALFGLLHHLPDDVALDLLSVIADSLSPSGRVVTVDIVTFEGQGRLDRWITDHDRGEYARSYDAWEALLRKRFARVDMELMRAGGRMLSSHLLVKMAEPLR